jgi:hypothetical protein
VAVGRHDREKNCHLALDERRLSKVRAPEEERWGVQTSGPQCTEPSIGAWAAFFPSDRA